MTFIKEGPSILSNAFRIVMQPESQCMVVHLSKEELRAGGATLAEDALGVPDNKYPQGRGGGTQLVYGIERDSVTDENLKAFKTEMKKSGFDQEE